MLKNALSLTVEDNDSWIRPRSIQLGTKSLALALLGAGLHPPSKFCGKQRSRFCAILLTKQPANGHG